MMKVAIFSLMMGIAAAQTPPYKAGVTYSGQQSELPRPQSFLF